MRSPSFPFYPRDWLSSKMVRREHLKNPTPISTYLYLLCEAWLEDPPVSLPADHTELASSARLTTQQFEAIWPVISHQFESDGNGRIYNPKQKEIYDKQQRAFENGSKGGNPALLRKRSVNRKVKP